MIIEPMSEDWAWPDAVAGLLDRDFVQAAEELAEPQQRPALDELFR